MSFEQYVLALLKQEIQKANLSKDEIIKMVCEESRKQVDSLGIEDSYKKLLLCTYISSVTLIDLGVK